MRKRKKLWVYYALLTMAILSQVTSPMFLLTTNCLSGSPSCICSWKGGKFVANCSYQSLNQVPKNDYFDYLQANAGNNQMPTLNRDIQQLNLASNNITTLSGGEFFKKKFRNLQKIYLNTNQLLHLDSSAFYKLTGLVELDLSENMISRFDEQLERIGEYSIEDFDDFKEKKSTNSAKNGSSFLQDLTQLRHLNLASNQLTRLDKFTFSSLTQLRQLFLSRNKISFIDKRAFDGLNVLNILHLDGNKLSHLDGEILLKLPQLHAIQLAGSNLWRCDCRLRKLVRLLMPREVAQNAALSSQSAAIQRQTPKDTSLSEATMRANILQDEPKCAPSQATEEEDLHRQSQPSSTGDPIVGNESYSKGFEDQASWCKEGEEKAWTNMKISEFECPPKLATQFIQQTSLLATPTTLPKNNQKDKIEMLIPPPTMITRNSDKRSRQLVTVYQHYLANELIELTCAFQITDELDLELSQLEWWQLSGSRKPILLWRSNNLTQAHFKIDLSNKSKETERSSANGSSSGSPVPPFTRKYAIIDYVTRANGSDIENSRNYEEDEIQEENVYGAGGTQSSGPNIKLSSRGRHCHHHQANAELMSGKKLIRVGHLIVDDDAANSIGQKTTEQERTTKKQEERLERLFLCRITNEAGYLDVLHSLTIDSASKQAQLEWKRREAGRKQFAAQSQQTQSLDRWLPMAAFGWSLEQAKSAVATELLAAQSSAPLFIALHLPEELTKTSETTGLTTNYEGFISLARSLNQNHQQPITRQTNGTNNSTVATSRITHTPYALDGIRIGEGTDPVSGTASSVELSNRHNYMNRSPMPRGSMHSIALSLIGRYTSNKRSLIMQQNDNDEPNFESSSSLEGFSHSFPLNAISEDKNNQPVGTRLRSAIRLLYTRYLDRWVQLSIGEAPLLLGLCAGLLAGCLFTMLIVLQLRCASHRRVVDSGNFGTKSVASVDNQDEDEDEDDDDNGDENDEETDYDEAGNRESPTDHRESVSVKEKPVSGGSSSSTTNGSQRKLIVSSDGESQLRGSVCADDLVIEFGSTNNSYLPDATVITNYKRFLDSSCNPDGDMNAIDEGDISGDLDDSRNKNQTRLNNFNKLTSITPQNTSKELLAQRHCNNMMTMKRQHGERRLIVVTPQQEMQELIISSPYYDDHHDHHSQQRQESLLSDADSSLIATYHHCNQQIGDCQQVACPLATYDQWPASCEEATIEDSSSSLLLTNYSQQLNTQPYMVAPPTIKSIPNGDTILLPYANKDDNHAICSISGKIEEQNYEHFCHQVPLPLRHNKAASPNNLVQITSSSSIASPVPSTSSSVTGSNKQKQQYSHRQQLISTIGENQNQNIVYLDGVLQLLHSSIYDCLQFKR